MHKIVRGVGKNVRESLNINGFARETTVLVLYVVL